MVKELALEKIRLYDPQRRPNDWTGVLSSSELAVFLSDVRGGQELDALGNQVTSSADSSCYVFPDFSTAEEFCRDLVLQNPSVQCEVFDRRGRAVDPLAVFVHPSVERHREDNPRRARLLIVGGVLSLLAAVLLFYFDWVRGGGLIWPSVIAVNCIGVSLRLVYWGSSILLRRRKQLQMKTESQARP